MADYHVYEDAPEGTPVSNFVHLHVHSDYSLLDGCCKIDAYVKRAKELNMKALALTDHGNMFGALNFEKLCHVNNINPVVGCEFYVAYGSHLEQQDAPYGKNGKGVRYFHLILLCENQTGYQNMCWLNSLGYKEGLYYGKPRIDFELLEKYHEGIICLSACLAGELPQMLLAGKDEEAEELALKYKNLFGPDHYYIELQNHGLPEQIEVAEKLVKVAKKLDIPMVLTNDCHYLNREDAEAQDALRCIGFKKLLDEAHQTMGEGRDEWYFKTEDEMRQILKGINGIDDSVINEAMENTVKIASMCDLTIKQYSTPELKGTLPRFELPKEYQRHGDDYQKNQNDYVRHIVEEGLKKRYPVITPEIRSRCEYEIGIIFSMGFSGYFLIVWEFINWSKSRVDSVHGNQPKPYYPIGPGRGSGAGSLVAYCMGITDIDPFRFKLIFERFLNPERVSMPDFDIDMDFDFRQQIIQHTRDLYGDEQVGHIVTFGTLKPKNCLADVGRVLNIPLSEVNALKKCIPASPKAKFKDAFNPPTEKMPDGGQLIPYKDDPRYQRLFSLCLKLEGMIRNTGLHASGMVIGLTALPNWAPVFVAEGKAAVQYTMDIIEPCGLVKFDYLGLKTLSLIRYTEEIINKHRPEGTPEFSVADCSDKDPETYEMFARGDTVAIFQFESPGMQKWMKALHPNCLEDLVAMNALYRPGPMDYIPTFVQGKNDPSTVKYPDPSLEDILKETYGVMVYQEQVMQVSQKIAGFSLGGADMLRRAMGKKKPEVLMGKKKEFIEGALKVGHTEAHADEIFEIMIPFAGYGFNKSHAAAYTVLAYRTGYLKCHYPAEFMAANLTNEITTTDGLPFYIEEARRIGVPVDAPDVNRSDKLFDVVDGHIVFGMKGIKGMGDGSADAIVAERNKNGPFKSFIDFLERVDMKQVGKKAVEVLIKTGGFDHVGESTGEKLTRATLIANFEDAIRFIERKKDDQAEGQLGLFDDTDEKVYAEYKFEMLPELPKLELLEMEKELIGCYVSGHPLDDYKEVMEKCATVNSKNIVRIAKNEQAQKAAFEATGAASWKNRYNGKTYTAIGSVSELREIMTKKGVPMAFAKLQDIGGSIDITFFPKTWEKMKGRIKNDSVYAFLGKVEMREDAGQMLVDDVTDISSLKEKSKSEIHILLEENLATDKDIFELKDFLFGVQGPCTIFLHAPTNDGEYIIKASGQFSAPAKEDFISSISQVRGVKEVWCV